MTKYEFKQFVESLDFTLYRLKLSITTIETGEINANVTLLLGKTYLLETYIDEMFDDNMCGKIDSYFMGQEVVEYSVIDKPKITIIE